MIPNRAHFKDWHSNLINDTNVENKSTQIRINPDLQLSHNETLGTSETSSTKYELNLI